MKLRLYRNGVALSVGRHRWDYWLPYRWMPLSGRARVRWWGSVTHRREAQS